MAYDPTLALPYDIPANEFLTLEGAQFPTSRNWAVLGGLAALRYHPLPEEGTVDRWRPSTLEAAPA